MSTPKGVPKIAAGQPLYCNESAGTDSRTTCTSKNEFYATLQSLSSCITDNASIRSLLEKAKPSRLDILDYTDPGVRSYIDGCRKYNIKIDCTIVNDMHPSDFHKTRTIADNAGVVASRTVNAGTRVNPAHFCVSNWLAIVPFLRYLTTLPSKGAAHRFATETVALLNDNWNQTNIHNSNKSLSQLKLALDKLGVKSSVACLRRDRKFKKFTHDKERYEEEEDLTTYVDLTGQMMQSMFGIKELDTKVDTVISKINETADQMKNTLANVNFAVGDARTSANQFTHTMIDTNRLVADSQLFVNQGIGAVHNTMPVLNRVLDKTEKTIDQFNNLVKDFVEKFSSSGFIVPLVLWIAKFISFCYLISQEENQNATSIAALVMLLMPTSVGNVCGKIFERLTRAVPGCIQYFTAGVRTGFLIGQIDMPKQDDHSILRCIYDLTKGVTCGLFTSVTPEQTKSMQISASKFKLLTDLLRGCHTLYDYLIKGFIFIFELVSKQILKCFGALPSFMCPDELEKQIQLFHDYKLSGYYETCTTNFYHATAVTQLHMDLLLIQNKMQKQLAAAKVVENFKITPYLNFMVGVLDKAVSTIPPHLRGFNSQRLKPFWLYIHGKPRTGKSAMFQAFIVNELVMRLKMRDAYEDPANYSCFRTCGDEFWDGYRGQIVTQYNDLFQGFTDEEAMNLAVAELTRAIDNHPLELNMADCPLKGKKFFVSTIVVSNAQADMVGFSAIADKCWSGGKHLYARRNIVVELYLTRKYQTPDGLIDMDVMNAEMQLFPDQCIGEKESPLFPKDMYKLRFTDPLDGRRIGLMDFEDGVEFIISSAKEHFAKEDHFGNNLRKHLEAKWHVPLQSTQSSSRLMDLMQLDTQSGEHACFSGQMDNEYCTIDDESIFQTPRHASPTTTFENARTRYLEDFNNISRPHCMCDGIILELEAFHSITPEYAANLHEIYAFAGHTCLDSFEQAYNMFADKRITPKQKISGVLLGLCAKMKAAAREFADWCVNQQNRIQHWGLMIALKIALTVLAFAGATYIGKKIRNYRLKKSNAGNKFAVDEIPLFGQTGEREYRSAKKVIRRQARQARARSIGPIQLIGHMYNQQNIDVEKLLKTHFVTLNVIAQFGDVITKLAYGNGLSLGGDVFIMPRHYWVRFNDYRELYEKNNAKIRLELTWTNESKTPVYFNNIDVYEPPEEYANDLVYLRIKQLCAARDIRNAFVSITDEPNYFGAYLYGVRSIRIAEREPMLLTVDGTEFKSIRHVIPETTDKTFNAKLKKLEYHVPRAYKYANCKTVVGDCGMLLIHTDNKLGGRRLLGMHIAGDAATGIGAAAPIYVEDLNQAFAFFSKKKPIITQLLNAQFLDYNNEPQGPTYEAMKEMGFNILGTTTTWRGKKIRLTLPSKTKISKSVVHDVMECDFGPHTHEPARLAPFVDEQGVRKSPFLMAADKMLHYSAMIPQDEIEPIAEHVSTTIRSWPSQWNTDEKRFLTDFETVNGMSGLNPIDMKSSPGFPYILDSPSQGKLPFFSQKQDAAGQYYYEMKPDLQMHMLDRMEMAKSGRIKETYFCDKQKDETRPLEKVRLGKTRIFQVGPVDLTLALRKTCGLFVAHCHNTFIDGEMASGINPNSYQWTLMMDMLLVLAKEFLNGDYSNYDGSLPHQIAMILAKCINDFYGDQHITMRETLIATLLNSTHIVEDIVFMLRQCNPSGSVFTTILNDICNMVFIRLAFIHLTKLDISFFNRYVKPKFFGDDNIASIVAEIRDQLNMHTYKKEMAKLGVTYTSADKKEIVDDLIDLEHASFLKRKWVKHPKFHLYLAQLDHDVIMEIPRWSESDPTNMADQMNRFNCCLLELANYSEEEFKKTREIFVEYCLELKREGYDIDPTVLFTYPLAMGMMYPQFFDASLGYKLLYELDKTDGQLWNSMLNEGPHCIVGKLLNYESIIDCEQPGFEIQITAKNQNTLTGMMDTATPLVTSELKEKLQAANKPVNENFENQTILTTLLEANENLKANIELILDVTLERKSYLADNEIYRETYDSIIGSLKHLLRTIRYQETQLISLQQREANTTLMMTARPVLLVDVAHPSRRSWRSFADTDTALVTQRIDDDAPLQGQMDHSEGIPFGFNVQQWHEYMHMKPELSDLSEEDDDSTAEQRVYGPMPDLVQKPFYPDLVNTAYREDSTMCIDYIRRAERDTKTQVEYMMTIPEMFEGFKRLNPNNAVDDQFQYARAQGHMNYAHALMFENRACSESDEHFGPVKLVTGQWQEGRIYREPRTKNEWRQALEEYRLLKKHRWEKEKEKEIELTGQMDNQATQEENQNTTTEIKEVTTYVDAEQPHDEQYMFNRLNVCAPMPPPSLSEFVNREYPIANFTWAASDAYQTLKSTLIFPNVMMHYLYDKIKRFAFWKPSFTLTIRMNSSSMHTGCLMCCWGPQFSVVNASYKNMISLFSSKYWTQISAKTGQVTKLQIPYTHYKEFMQVSTNELIEVATMYTYVSIPLGALVGTPASVNVSIYAGVVNEQLNGYSYDEFSQPSLARDRHEITLEGQMDGSVEAAKKPSKVVTIAKGISDFAARMSSIPVVGSWARPISIASLGISQILGKMGLSVPNNVSTPQPMFIRQPKLLQIMDTPNAVHLAQRQDAMVAKSFAHVNGHPSDLSIMHLAQIPGLIYYGQITTSMAEGTILFVHYVSPRDCWYNDYTNVSGGKPNFYNGTMGEWLARYFGQWRGSEKLAFHFEMPDFSSLRVKISYNPTSNNQPTIEQSYNCVGEVWDLNGTKDYKFTIPFRQPTEWLFLDREGAATSPQTENNGILTMSIVNPLTSGQPTVNPIYFQVFSSWGVDFQLANPTTTTIEHIGYFRGSMDTLEGQMGQYDCNPCGKDAITPCFTPTSSSQCLMEADYPILGGIECAHCIYGVQSACETTSTRQLMNMACKIRAVTLSTQTLSSPISDYLLVSQGSAINIEDSGYPGVKYNYLMNMLTIYRYMRGGWKLTILSDTDMVTTARQNTIYYKDAGAATTTFSNSSTFTVFDNTGNESQALFFTPTTKVSPAEVSSAYFSRNNCNLISIQPPGHVYEQDIQNVATVSTALGATVLASSGGVPGYYAPPFNIFYSLSCGDDFLTGFVMPVPLAQYTAPMVAVRQQLLRPESAVRKTDIRTSRTTIEALPRIKSPRPSSPRI